MRLPIGYDNFADIRENKFDFVDKSLLIKELLDETFQVVLITRPRRFGKTLNLSMLQHFFTAQIYGKSTSKLFDGLKISRCGEKYTQHQGKYPVIFITFKDIKDGKFVTAYEKLRNLLAKSYREHQYLLSSDKLTEVEKRKYLSVLEEQISEANIQSALQDLSYYLFQHYGEKVWLLIDEYDTPLQAAYFHGYLQPMLEMMRGIFSMALKTNSYLKRAVLTGILKIAKENLFSDLNNLIAYSLLNSEYGQYFGFTEEEMEDILHRSGLQEKAQQIRNWYNGYQVGDVVVYNPWSIANCLKNNGALQPYWVNTSGNELIKQLLAQSDENVKNDFQMILEGKSIEATINPNIVFNDLGKDSDSLYSLLLLSGYLKATRCEHQGLKFQCILTPPNQEVSLLYPDIITYWFSESMTKKGYESFLKALVQGRIEEFTARLQDYLLESFSFFDVKGNRPEIFYHGFVLGLVVGLKETHEVKSNRESGYGVYDVMLIPKDNNQLGLILEFKTVRSADQDLKESASKALQQIKERGYAAELQQKGIQKILSVGLAFRGKQVMILAE